MKTKIKSIVSAIGLLAMCAASSSQANVYNLSSFTAIDLGLADFVAFSGDATLIPSFGNEFTEATVNANGSHFTNDPFSVSLNISEGGGKIQSSASINPQAMLSKVDVSGMGHGESTTEYILDYTVAGNGQIEVSVPYQISIDAMTMATNDLGSSASGLVSIQDSRATSVNSQFLQWLHGDGNGTIDNIGLIKFMMDVNDGDTGSLRFFAQADADLLVPAPVPLPATSWFMISGLFGIALRRKSEQKKLAL